MLVLEYILSILHLCTTSLQSEQFHYQAEKVGAVLPGEGSVVWRPHSNLPVPERGLQGSLRGKLHRELK